MSGYNVLSIDGGGVFVLMPLLFLRRIEQDRPGFLASVDLFAGTSAGGISAVMLAAYDNPVDGLDAAIRFWETTPILAPGARNVVGGLTGSTSLYSNRLLRSALEQVLGRKRLKEFTTKVLVASIQLDDQPNNPELRSWRPRSLSNLAVDGTEFLDHPAVDIALRSAAAPIVWPVVQGYVDGGLFANDPSMLALSRVLKERRPDAKSDSHARDVLADISLFSLGEGQIRRYLPVNSASWGYRHWLLNRKQPLALLELALSSTGEEIGEQCTLLLGGKQYFRLNPETKPPVSLANYASTPWARLRHGVDWIRGAAEELGDPMELARRKAQELGATYDLTETFTWIDLSSWLKSGTATARPQAP